MYETPFDEPEPTPLAQASQRARYLVELHDMTERHDLLLQVLKRFNVYATPADVSPECVNWMRGVFSARNCGPAFAPLKHFWRE